jgi:Ca2+-binding EF-hand superfamily protein
VKLFPRLSAAFDEADTNHDNYISYEEVRAFAVKYRAERERQRAAQAQNTTHATPSSAASATAPATTPETN